MSQDRRELTELAKDLIADGQLHISIATGFGPQDLRPWQLDELNDIISELQPGAPRLREVSICRPKR